MTAYEYVFWFIVFHRTDAVRIIYSFNSLECLFFFSFSFVEMYSSTTPHRAFRFVDFEGRGRDVVENWIKVEYRVWWRETIEGERQTTWFSRSTGRISIPLCLCGFVCSVQLSVCYFPRVTARCPCGFKWTGERFSFDAPQPSYRTDSFSISKKPTAKDLISSRQWVYVRIYYLEILLPVQLIKTLQIFLRDVLIRSIIVERKIFALTNVGSPFRYLHCIKSLSNDTRCD